MKSSLFHSNCPYLQSHFMSQLMYHSSSLLPSPWYSSIHMLFMMRFIQSAKYTLVKPSKNGKSIPTCSLCSDLSTIASWRSHLFLKEPWTLMKLLDLRGKQALVSRCHNRIINNNHSSKSCNKTRSLIIWWWITETMLIHSYQMSKLIFLIRCPNKKTTYKLHLKDLIRNYKKLQRKLLIVNLERKFKLKISWQWFKVWTSMRLDTLSVMKNIKQILFFNLHSSFSTVARSTESKTKHTNLPRLTLRRNRNWTMPKLLMKILNMNMIK